MANENKIAEEPKDSVFFKNENDMVNFFVESGNRDDFKNKIEKEVRNAYEGISKDINEEIKDLLIKCRIFANLYNSEVVGTQYKASKGFYTATSSQQTESVLSKAFSLGFQIMYRARKLVLDEEIMLRIMVEEQVTNNGVKTTNYGIKQFEIYNLLDFDENFIVNLKNNRINLRGVSNLKENKEGKSNLNSDLQKSFIEKWGECIAFSGIETDDFSDKKDENDKYIDPNTGVTMYRHRHTAASWHIVRVMDTVTRKKDKKEIKTKQYYYVLNEKLNSPYTFFNKGNLFEWFDAYMDETLASLGDTKKFIDMKFEEENFDDLFRKFEPDEIPGHLQGDYFSKNLNQWVQNKFGSGERIAQLTAIRDFILGKKKNFKGEEDSKGTAASHGLLNILETYNKESTRNDTNFIEALTNLVSYSEGNPYYKMKKKEAETVAKNAVKNNNNNNAKNNLQEELKSGVKNYLSEDVQSEIKTRVLGA